MITNQDFYNEGYLDALADIKAFVGNPIGDERTPMKALLEEISRLKGLQENA